jgi:O-acetyl-ADP-ribose deacetylase (regulator of RNase III)
MGAGIAKAIATQFPEALEADKRTPKGDKAKLGTISVAEISRGGQSFSIVNAYTQYHWRGRGRKADYDAIDSCFKRIACAFQSQRIGYPMIGAGLAGGDWSVIEKIIHKQLSGLDHSLVLLPGVGQ